MDRLFTDSRRLLIVGASARAAAASASRSGIPVSAIDLFADGDLRRLAGGRYVRRVAKLDAAVGVQRQLPSGPWMYTGGIENRPGLVTEISLDRPLFGNSAAVLQGVRDPAQLGRCLRAAGIPYPDLVERGPVPMSGRWLRKRVRSCGGLQVQDADPGSEVDLASGSYAQRFQPGDPFAATYLAWESGCRLVGVTRQILMQDTDHPDRVTHPYRYVGSIASSADASWHDAKAHARWQHIGASISRQFGLRGLFGIDAVVTGRGEFSEITPIEVNPRYTASVELLERATGFAAIARHCDAFAGRECDKGSIWRALRPFLGKLVVYSPATFVIDRAFEQRIDEMNRDVDYPMITDIPWPGTSVQSGEPVVTIHAAAESLEELARQLGLWGWGGPGARLHDAIRQSASA